jgi:tetratricopeptide (TPR) repeat protein
MPEYLATGRRADGRKVTENVVCNSADEAMRLLAERGYNDVVLHSDDISAQIIRQREKAEYLSPRDFILIRDLPPRVGLFVVRTMRGYRKMWPAMALVALALAYLRYAGGPWGFWDWLGLVFLLSPPALAAVLALCTPPTRARYQRMLEALYWGRWEEALRLADQVEHESLARDIPFRKAQALAGMDRLDEALKLVAPLGDGKAMAPWFYRSMLAQVYDFATRRDEAIAQLEQAVELAPDNATMLLSLARSVIWQKRDVRRARELLSRARAHALSDMTSPFADLVEGVILLEAGQPRDALPILEAAHKVLYSRRNKPLGYLPVEQAMLGRALAHDALGESDEALNLYTKVRPRLLALRNPVIDRCDRAIGLPQGG